MGGSEFHKASIMSDDAQDHDGPIHAENPTTEKELVEASRLQDVRVPQPSEDPNDPLNWSPVRKNMVLFAVCLGAFQCDFATSGFPAIILQAVDWKKSPNSVNTANNLFVILLGIAPLFWIPISQFWGRAPVLFWSSLGGFAFGIGCALAPDFDTFYACRALQGVFISSYVALGLNVITDIFFFHEHARKIGFWIVSILIPPYIGAGLANFMLYYLGDWRPIYWMIAAVSGFNFAVTALLVEETYYDRSLSPTQQPPRGTKLARITGFWQIRHHGYFKPVLPEFQALANQALKPLVILSFFYFLLAYMWFVGTAVAAPVLLQTPVEFGGFGYNSKTVGFLYFAPSLGVFIGEVFGHFFNDWLAARYIRNHGGHYLPEARLPANMLAAFLMIPGLVIIGQFLHHHLHWIAVAFGWALLNWGSCITAVALYAYVSDSYPSRTAESSAILNLSRCVGGFSVGYFELPWGLRAGYDVSFGIQAALVGVSLLFVIFFKLCGPKLRHWTDVRKALF